MKHSVRHPVDICLAVVPDDLKRKYGIRLTGEARARDSQRVGRPAERVEILTPRVGPRCRP